MAGAIPSSVHVPLADLPAALSMQDGAFERAYGCSKPAREQELIFYCKKGIRSTTACEVALESGYKKSVYCSLYGEIHLISRLHSILNYKGSWLDWVERELRA